MNADQRHKTPAIETKDFNIYSISSFTKVLACLCVCVCVPALSLTSYRVAQRGLNDTCI